MQRLSKASNERGGEAARGGVARCAHRVLDAVPPVIWFIRKQMRQHRQGLSLAQFRTLCAVDRQPAISLSGLAEHLGASLPTASRVVSGLVSKGYLLRAGSDADRRQLELGLSPVGRSVLESAWEATQKHMEGKMAELPREQRETIVSALEILRGVFGSAGIPEPAPLKPDGKREGRGAGRLKSSQAVGV